jgi:hypothetical protein
MQFNVKKLEDASVDVVDIFSENLLLEPGNREQITKKSGVDKEFLDGLNSFNAARGERTGVPAA